MDLQKTTAKVLATLTFIVGLVMFVGSLVVGIVLIVRTDPNFRYYRFFLRHPYAETGLYLLLSAFTFWLPFTAFGAYISTKLRGEKGSKPDSGVNV
jgi:hypothetical protein